MDNLKRGFEGNLEREKKYFVSETEAKRLKERAISKLGVAQWYLIDCSQLMERLGLGQTEPVSKPSEGCRIRYTLTPEGEERWVIAFKTDVGPDFTREEWEAEFEPFEGFEGLLKGQPVVVKVRYFMLLEPAEVVLDEFLKLDVEYPVQVCHIVEVETDKYFEDYESLFELKTPLNVEEFRRYSNKNLAVKSNLSFTEIKAMLTNALKSC